MTEKRGVVLAGRVNSLYTQRLGHSRQQLMGNQRARAIPSQEDSRRGQITAACHIENMA